MYYSSQTLRHKDTNKLVALHPLHEEGSIFNWEVGKHTSLIDENGVLFYDNINNYTPILDWFGRPASTVEGEKSTSKHIDTTLKKYLFVSGEEREIKKQQALEQWRDRLLKRLETETHIYCWYADGSICPIFRKYFMEYIKAKPLIEAWNNICKEFVPKGYTFRYKKRKFYIGYGHDEISLVKT